MPPLPSGFAHDASFLLAESITLSAGARVALFCLVALLAVILVILVACALLVRRSPGASRAGVAAGNRAERAADAMLRAATLEASPRRARRAGSGSAAAGGGLAVVSSAMACPTCRREMPATTQYCPHDARRLVPAAELGDRARSAGSVCPACKRAYDPGVRFCAHDGGALLPLALYEASRGPIDVEPTGVIAKICPDCGDREDLASLFCGHCGTELAAIN